ncbi:MAG: class I SAM-dependent methyltransferase [Elusimicrobia bacterium]|nr:class I SAM-dependent methyltransferase [Elusimicrobiota bacterium]
MGIERNDIESVPCNLCGSGESEVLFQSADRLPGGAPGHYAATTDKFGAYGTIRRCLRCGLAYTSPRLKPGEILEEYQETQDQDYLRECDARSMNAYLSLAVIRRYAAGGRLLDVGCATGFFLNAARVSYEVIGVEPSCWAREFAEKQLHVPVAVGTLEEACFPDGRFDVVTLIDVLEHLPDPMSTMREVFRVTKPGGIVYVMTPDIDSLSARFLRSRWWGLRPAHLTYFSRKTLAALLEKCGYEILYARSYGRIFTWQYWLSRLSNYPAFLRRAVGSFIGRLGIEDKFLYLDTRDSVQMMARKR